MKANELRIGNHIFLKSKSKEYQLTSGYEIDTGIDSDDFKPIPLTPEWLERFGFEYSEDFLVLSIYTIRARLSWHISWGFEICIISTGYSLKIKIEYVHQLQNLYFVLTGEELICSAQ